MTDGYQFTVNMMNSSVGDSNISKVDCETGKDLGNGKSALRLKNEAGHTIGVLEFNGGNIDKSKELMKDAYNYFVK